MFKAVDIFYVGFPDPGYFAKQYAEQNGLSYAMSDLPVYKAQGLEEAVFGRQPRWLIVNYDSIDGMEDRESAGVFAALSDTLGCEAIILAAGHDRGNAVLTNFAEHGVAGFITGVTEGKKREELDRIIRGEQGEGQPKSPEEIATLREENQAEYDRALLLAGVPEHIVNGAAPPEAAFPQTVGEPAPAPSAAPQQTSAMQAAPAFAAKPGPTATPSPPQTAAGQSEAIPRKISVFGARRGIGTTTIAVQLAKYLLGQGKNPCIVEMNGTGWVSALSRFYEAGTGRHGETVFEKVAFFDDPSAISKILSMPEYHAVIYDLGSASDPAFNFVAAAGNDLAICALGDSPLDFAASEAVFGTTSKMFAPQFVFSLVHEHNRKHILAEMDNLAPGTHFAGYAPDPFKLAEENREVFAKAIEQGRPQTPEAAKRKGWFKR